MTSDRAPRLSGSVADDPVYGAIDIQRQRGIRSYVGVPLELSDGTRIGALSALSGEPDRFEDSDLEFMAVLGRMLAYEWERVKRELELRRLKDEARGQDDTDPLTGIAHRRAFVTRLEREWELNQRGSAESWLVVVTLTGLVEANERFGHAMGDLLLKDAARALGAVARGPDVVGRIGGDQFGAVLVGCKGAEGAAAFCDRLRLAMARVTGERPTVIESSYAVGALTESASAEAALQTAEAQAREPLPSSSS
jgi:diguanylate cyclase (GGDEF)-like protein